MTPTDLAEFTNAIVNMAKSAKSALCAATGGPADSPPIMLWHGKGEIEIVALPMPSDDEAEMTAPALLDSALRQGFIDFGKPEYVAFISEAYMRTAISEEDAKSVKRGDMQKAFQSGLTTDINEIISIVTFTPEGASRHSVVIVKYGDDGMPEFENYFQGEEGHVGGAIMDVVSGFVKFVNAE